MFQKFHGLHKGVSRTLLHRAFLNCEVKVEISSNDWAFERS